MKICKFGTYIASYNSASGYIFKALLLIKNHDITGKLSDLGLQ